MIHKLVAAFVTILFAASIHATAFADNGFIPVDGDTKRLDDGHFKAGDIIRVTGCCAQPENFAPKDSYAKTFARQAARLDALRFLVEWIDGVDPKEESPGKIISRISHDSKAFNLLEKNARVIDVKFWDGGGCEVSMELIFPADWKR